MKNVMLTQRSDRHRVQTESTGCKIIEPASIYPKTILYVSIRSRLGRLNCKYSSGGQIHKISLKGKNSVKLLVMYRTEKLTDSHL